MTLSPFVLSRLDRELAEVNWTPLSEIGATYGAVSAIIAVIALIGAAASLIMSASSVTST